MLIPTVSNPLADSECKIPLQNDVRFVQIQGTVLGNCANFTGNLARTASVLSH